MATIEQQRRYRAKNRKKVNAIAVAWYAKNRDRIRAQRHLKRPNLTVEQKLAKAERSAAAKKERRRIKKHARKAAERGCNGRMSKGLKDRLHVLQKGRCAYCQEALTESHLDHIMPLALGGSGHDANYQLLCPSCNIRKGAKHPTQYAQEIGLLL